MAIALAKVSGVLSITQTAGYPRYYAATAVGNAKFSPNSSGDGVNITIAGDSFCIPLTELTVNSQSPANMGVALVLLNSIFGS